MNPPRKSARGRSFGLRFLVRLVGWSFSAAIALLVLAYVALPVLLRYGLPHALARYGVESSVQGARVNLVREKVTLFGFQVGQAGGPAIRWGEVTARVDTAELLKGNIRIIDFQVKDARVDLEQLRASEWRPPDRITAIPELRKLNIKIGGVLMHDLEFLGLSERIGQKIVLRSLSVGSLSHLEAGDRVAFQLEGVIGEATLRLAGRVRMVDNLPVFEGRYELGALNLRGFGRLFGLVTPGAVGGRIDGNGNFDLAFVQEEGGVRVDLSGRASISDLELSSAGTRITRTGAEWNGEATVLWPMAGGLPGFVVGGSVASPAVEAAWRAGGAPVGILARGLEWNGEIRRGSGFSMDGRLSGESLRIDSSREEAGRFDLELSHLSADSRFRSGGSGYALETGKLVAESATFAQMQGRRRSRAKAFRVLLEKVRLGDGGYAIDRLAAESLEAVMLEGETAKPSQSAEIIQLGLSGLASRSGGGVLVDRLESAQAKFEFGSLSFNLADTRALNVLASAATPFEAGAVSASNLRLKSGELETWGTGLELSGARLTALGALVSDEAASKSLSQAKAGEPFWEANGVRAAKLSIGSDGIEAGTLSMGNFVFGKTGANLIQIDHGEGSDFFIAYASGIDAASVKLEQLRYRSGQISALDLTDMEMTAPGITFPGKLTAKRIDADHARYVDGDANVSLLESLKLGELSAELSDRFRVDAARANWLVHDRAAGPDYEAEGLDLSDVEGSASGRASAAAGRLDTLGISLDDGARLILEGIAASYPAYTRAGAFSADGGSVRKLSYSVPGGRIVQVLDIDVGAIDDDGTDAHRITSLNAASAEASDPEAGGSLQSAALQIAAIRISKAGGVRAERASVNDVSVKRIESDVSAAFSTTRINVNGPVLGADGRLRLGEVLVDAAVLAMGLDGQDEFVLPGLPFFSAGGEASGSVAMTRLETRQPARLDFYDGSTAPPFEIVISPLQVRVENFHTADPGRRAKFSVEGRAGEFSTLNATGEFSIEKDGLELEVSGKVDAFDLNRLNMYAAKHTKRAIRSGRGDAGFDIAVKGRKLSGTIRFVFSRVTFEPAGPSRTAEGENAAELSLQHSFAMLKDRDGIVRLTVPLSGSLDDPKFDFSDGLVQALMKTVRSTVMLTFKPLGLLVSAAELIGGSEVLELKPVAFHPGERSLSGEGLAHLDALARELEKHPAVEVRICGRAVSADRIRIEQRHGENPAGTQPPPGHEASGSQNADALLFSLAEGRASTVRSYLEEKKQISRERLFNCEAKVESTPGRLPRVDLPVMVETRSSPAAAPKPSQ